MSSDQAAAPPTATMKDDGKGAAEQAVKCPRCDSSNTKFCYYNNYSLTQPRHFCKTCRRYWTKGGALRNVPIGGGCRKNKKIKSSSDAKFFTGPAMDFQLGSSSSFPRVLQHQYGHYMSAQFSSSSALDSPGSSVPPVLCGALQEMNNKTTGGSGLACSIESLSCINQDLHWKLQQQRLAMLFGDTNGGADNNSATVPLKQEKRNVMMFENSRKEGGADVATEWFFGSSYSNHTTGGGGDWDTGVQGHHQNHQYTTAFALHSDTI